MQIHVSCNFMYRNSVRPIYKVCFKSDIWIWFSLTLGITTNWEYFQLSYQLRDFRASQVIWNLVANPRECRHLLRQFHGRIFPHLSIEIQNINKRVSVCRASFILLIHWGVTIRGQSPTGPPILLSSFIPVPPFCSNCIRNPQNKYHLQCLLYLMKSRFLVPSRSSIAFLAWAPECYIYFICIHIFFPSFKNVLTRKSFSLCI